MTIVVFFRNIRKGTELFGAVIGAVINTALLGMVYLIGIGLTSIVAKIIKKHFLEIVSIEERVSYWNDLSLKRENQEEYYRQF